MKYLLIDIGNTAIKWGWFEKNICIEKKTTPHTDILPEFPLLPDFIVISNVVYNEQRLENLFSLYKNIPVVHCKLNEEGELFFQGKKIYLPVNITYQTPHTLGSDRLASVLGAYSLYPKQNVIIVDFGTCIKYEVLTKEGVYLGGAISPGINMRYQAVHHFTAKLPLLSVPETLPDPVGKTTHEAIHAGILHAVYCEVNGMIQHYKELLGMQEATVVFSGGEAQYLVAYKNLYTFATQNLVFTGLQMLAESCVKYMQEI
jgi:type III pantothenate kinase